LPDLGFSTESEDADTSLSTIDDPFSAWLVSSPGKFPDTPIRRSTSGSTSGSFLDKLRRASPEKPSASASSSSRLLPEGLGLGFNFSIPLTSSGRKRQRSESSLDIGIDDEDFEELDYPRLKKARRPQAPSRRLPRSTMELKVHRSMWTPSDRPCGRSARYTH
ncbi:hypothetical protein DFH11DRAFT_1619526, partial [Phellopilus nigrolimitatus]